MRQIAKTSPGFKLDDLALSAGTMDALQSYFAGILQLAIDEGSLRNIIPGVTPDEVAEITKAVALAKHENREAATDELADYPWLSSLLLKVKDAFYGEIDPEFLRPTIEKAKLVNDALYGGILAPSETALMEACFGMVDGVERSYRQCARDMGYFTDAGFTRVRKMMMRSLMKLGECLVPAFAKSYFPDLKSCSLDYLGLPLPLRNALHRPARRNSQQLLGNTTIQDLTEKTNLDILCYISHINTAGDQIVQRALTYFGLSLAPKTTHFR